MKRCVIQIYILAMWYHKRGCVLWGLSRQCVFLCTLVSLAGIKLANFSPSRQKKVSIKCPGLRESSFLNKAEQLGYLKTLLPCLYKKCSKRRYRRKNLNLLFSKSCWNIFPSSNQKALRFKADNLSKKRLLPTVECVRVRVCVCVCRCVCIYVCVFI